MLSKAQFGADRYRALAEAANAASSHVDIEHRGRVPRAEVAPQETVHHMGEDGNITSRLEGGY
jgi:hypothetical protein